MGDKAIVKILKAKVDVYDGREWYRDVVGMWDILVFFIFSLNKCSKVRYFKDAKTYV
ncbi:hypothetical protein [Acinetobacter sp. YH12239]|uniref:hypothetical protein n=1 Tax=Acinetobacter sp. YH12239 TaxID=2601166 RepID=UPI0015D15631|nr:hypothetical protein [Acinetobacter sp. YH12239]